MLILHNVWLAKNVIQVFRKMLDFPVNFLSASASLEVCHLECAICATSCEQSSFVKPCAYGNWDGNASLLFTVYTDVAILPQRPF